MLVLTHTVGTATATIEETEEGNTFVLIEGFETCTEHDWTAVVRWANTQLTRDLPVLGYGDDSDSTWTIYGNVVL